MSFNSFDAMIEALTASTPQHLYQTWQKNAPAATGANTWFTTWAWAGVPQAGDYSGTALNAQQCTDATAGSIWHGGNVSALTKHLTKLGTLLPSGAPGLIMLVDRLLYYPTISATSTANQALVNGVTLPRYTDGKGVRAWIEVTTAFGVTTGVFTFGDSGYTNSASQTGRQHGITVNTTASSVLHRIPHSGVTANNNYNPFLPMQAGDIGVKSVESVKFTTAHTTNGVCALVLGYPILTIPFSSNSAFYERDCVYQIGSLPRIYDGACLQILVYSAGITSGHPIFGDLDVAWG